MCQPAAILSRHRQKSSVIDMCVKWCSAVTSFEKSGENLGNNDLYEKSRHGVPEIENACNILINIINRYSSSSQVETAN